MKQWYLLVTLLVWVGTWNWYPLLPEVMVTHWGLFGEANGWMARLMGAWMIPVLLLLVWGLLEWAPYAQKIGEEKTAFWKAYQVFGLGILLFLAGLQVAVMGVNLGLGVNMAKVMGWGLVLMSAFMGRILPGLPRNSVMGVRTPWSLASDWNWRLTHEKTARGCRAMSLLGIIALIVLSPPYGAGVVVVGFLVSLLWGVVVSFIHR